jgi:hypothetical protein
MASTAPQSPSPDRILATLIHCLFDLKSAAMTLGLALESLLPLLRADDFKQVLAEHLALTRQLAELRAGAALPNAINLLECSDAHPQGPERRKIATTIIRACSIARPRATDRGSARSVRATNPDSLGSTSFHAPAEVIPEVTPEDTREAAALIRSLVEPVAPVALAPLSLSRPAHRPQVEVPPKPHRKQHPSVQRMLQASGAC